MFLTFRKLALCAGLAAATAVAAPALAETTLRIGTVLAPADPMGWGWRSSRPTSRRRRRAR